MIQFQMDHLFRVLYLTGCVFQEEVEEEEEPTLKAQQGYCTRTEPTWQEVGLVYDDLQHLKFTGIK